MRRTATSLMAVAILSAGLSVMATGTAHAVDLAPTLHESTTPPSSASPKSARAYCPVGTSILGGGAQITGAGGQVALLTATPVFDPLAAPGFQKYFKVLAAEDKNGTKDPWGLIASVYCSSHVSTVVVDEPSPLNSIPVKTAQVDCPQGMKVVGAGGSVTLNQKSETQYDAQVNLVSFRPTDDLTGVTARATEPGGILDDDYAGTWRVTAMAVCGTAYDVGGINLRQITVSPWMDVTKPDARAEVYCFKGQRLIVAGADLADDTANTYLTWAIRSNFANTKVSAYAHLNPEMGISTGADLTVYGICVDG